MSVLVLVSSEEEIPLVRALGFDYPVLVTGVGGANVIRATASIDKNTHVINVGYCGSKFYDKGTPLVIGLVETYHENAEFGDGAFCDDFEGLFKSDAPNYEVASCFTSTDFVTHTNIGHPCVFDMELAFIRALFNKVSAIKVVSDNLSREEYDQWVSESMNR